MSEKLHRVRKALFVTACVAAAGAVLSGALVLQGEPLEGLAARMPDALARHFPGWQAQVAQAPGSVSQPAAPQPGGEPPTPMPGGEPPRPEPQPAAAPDYMIFGMLPATITSPASPAAGLAPVSATPGIASLPLSATSLAGTPLQSIGDTFSGSTARALPELGGAAALDGPADAGLEEPVSQAALADPQVPPPTGKIIVLDASEGTKLDPLRQRNWDLNSAHAVPQIKPQP